MFFNYNTERPPRQVKLLEFIAQFISDIEYISVKRNIEKLIQINSKRKKNLRSSL